jgi:hypothetical protein
MGIMSPSNLFWIGLDLSCFVKIQIQSKMKGEMYLLRQFYEKFIESYNSRKKRETLILPGERHNFAGH